MATPHGPASGAIRGPSVSCGRKEAPEALAPEQLARLLELSRALAGACEHEEVAIVAAERARELARASAAQVSGVRAGGRLAVVAESTGAARAVGHRMAAEIGPGAPEHDVVRGGAPMWIGNREEARERCPSFPPEALPGGPDGVSWAFLPLVADNETSGVLTLVFDELQAFDDGTRRFLGEVAEACGNALARGSLFSRERARANASEKARAAAEVRLRNSDGRFADRTHLYERERFARARAEAETVVAVHAADDLERVHPLTAALFVADTAQDVVTAVAQHGAEAFGAVRVELTWRAALATGEAGSEPPEAEAEVLRSGVPLWLDGAELALRFPGSSQALLARGAGSWLGVPVPGRGGVAAVLSVAFPRERAFTRGDRARLVLLATECASVLSRCTARDEGAAARAERDAAAATPPAAFVVQYDEVGVDGPVMRVLGVFSSEAAAREALRDLDRARSLVVHASITAWTLDAARPGMTIEVEPWRIPPREAR